MIEDPSPGVLSVVAAAVGRPVSLMVRVDSLARELGTDGMVNLLEILENEFGIQFPEEVVDRWRTLSDIAGTIKGLSNGNGSTPLPPTEPPQTPFCVGCRKEIASDRERGYATPDMKNFWHADCYLQTKTPAKPEIIRAAQALAQMATRFRDDIAQVQTSIDATCQRVLGILDAALVEAKAERYRRLTTYLTERQGRSSKK